MGISVGAFAFVLLIGVSVYVVARRTAPARAAKAKKRALRKPLTACGLTRLLQQAGVSDDEQVLERAAAWVRANKPGSVEDIIQFGMVQGFVDSLNLHFIPKHKLLAAFAGRPRQATPVATESITIERANEMEEEPGGGGSWFSGSAGAASSSSTQPTLTEAAEILKRELGLKGNLKDVVREAAEQLELDVSLPLVELARLCVQKLGVPMPQKV